MPIIIILVLFGALLVFVSGSALASIESNPDSIADGEIDIPNTENPMQPINNISPFLDVIAFSEGANYTTLVGGGTFTDFSDHPANLGWNGIHIRGVKTTAAGRYQITQTTFNSYKSQFGITDFSPLSQDSFATQLVQKRGAYGDAVSGNLLSAMRKCVNEWESFKLMFAGTYPITIQQAQNEFTESGGILA